MTKVQQNNSAMLLSPRVYLFALIVSSSLYFLRLEEFSIYVFDVVWVLGLFLFPALFFRAPKALFAAFIMFSITVVFSLFLVLMDGRPFDPIKAAIALYRYSQIVITANFMFNCLYFQRVEPRDFFMPATVSILVVLIGGMALYFISNESAMAFNRYSGFLRNPNSMALYVVVCTPVLISLARTNGLASIWVKLAAVLIIVLLVYSIAMTGSNSGILLLCASLFLFFLMSRFGFLMMLIVAAFFVTVGDIFAGYLSELAHSMISGEIFGIKRSGTLLLALAEGENLSELGSQSYRREIAGVLYAYQFESFYRIVFGIGPGQSAIFMQEIDGNSVTIHNFFQVLFLEYGVIGSTAFGSLIYLLLRRFRWDKSAFQLIIGFVLASTGTPSLYLPFYWAALLATLAGKTAYMVQMKSARVNGKE